MLLLVWDEKVVLGLGRRVQGALERHRGVPFCAAGRTGGGSGFCGVFVCVRASKASAGRAFNLSGQPDGEQRPAVSYSGARAEQVGSSSRRTAFKGRLGVILRCVETRTLACQLGPRGANNH